MVYKWVIQGLLHYGQLTRGEKGSQILDLELRKSYQVSFTLYLSSPMGENLLYRRLQGFRTLIKDKSFNAWRTFLLLFMLSCNEWQGGNKFFILHITSNNLNFILMSLTIWTWLMKITIICFNHNSWFKNMMAS